MNKNKHFLFDSDSLKNFHKRIFFSVLVFSFCFSSAFGRITYISISSYFDDPSNIIIKKNITRGNIYDRNGLVLAATVNSKSLYAEANLLDNVDLLSIKLEKILNIDKDVIKRKLSSKKNFIYLKRNITPLEHQNIIDLGEIHLKFDNENKRLYPYENSVSHLVGFVNIDQKGQRGIERFYNDHYRASLKKKRRSSKKNKKRRSSKKKKKSKNRKRK